MTTFLGLNDLYRQLPGTVPDDNGMGGAHFNIIKVEDLVINGETKHTSYSRRSFFKVSLVEGDFVVHYADRSIAVNGFGLVFTNPTVPYKWEIVSKKQQGYVCVFTESFFGKDTRLKEYPVFSSPDKAVVLPDAETFSYFREKFSKMDAELQSNYTYKYDYLRSLLMELIHEAQKLQPETGVVVPSSNASERIAVLFTDVLERQFTIEDSNDVVELKTPSDFANRLNIHVNHLNKSLKEATGQTTSQLIKNRVL